MQVKMNGWSWWRVPLVIVVNFAAWPLCALVALSRMIHRRY